MRTIIAGSRTITDYEIVAQAIDNSNIEIDVVITGCARGVDALGELWATLNNIPVEKYPADWNKHGKRAGFLRNAEMAKVADALIAVTTGSPGTRNMIDLARKAGLKVYVKQL